MDDKNRIKYAYFLLGWSFDSGNKNHLKNSSAIVIPLEYLPAMKGNIFCPECSAPLYRSPEVGDKDSRQRQAFYAHSRRHSPVCSLRVRQAEGKRYDNEEDARKAIENGELAIVDSFMKERPVLPKHSSPLIYDQEPNEDRSGLMTQVAISRHKGEEFNLPSVITTVRGLCRNFDRNLNKYFLLPGQQSARTLRQLLKNVDELNDVIDENRLYYGRIVSFRSHGEKPGNILFTWLAFTKKNDECIDFCIKATNESSNEQGINDDAIGRIVIIYGKVEISGIGLCVSKPGWGEYALLPPKYEYLIDDV